MTERSEADSEVVVCLRDKQWTYGVEGEDYQGQKMGLNIAVLPDSRFDIRYPNDIPQPLHPSTRARRSDPFLPENRIPLPAGAGDGATVSVNGGVPSGYLTASAFGTSDRQCGRRRNERERLRVRTVNEGFERLRSFLPLGEDVDEPGVHPTRWAGRRDGWRYLNADPVTKGYGSSDGKKVQTRDRRNDRYERPITRKLAEDLVKNRPTGHETSQEKNCEITDHVGDLEKKEVVDAVHCRDFDMERSDAEQKADRQIRKYREGQGHWNKCRLGEHEMRRIQRRRSSKVDVLKGAIWYIKHLQNILEQN